MITFKLKSNVIIHTDLKRVIEQYKTRVVRETAEDATYLVLEIDGPSVVGWAIVLLHPARVKGCWEREK